MKAPFPWFGGKRQVAQLVWERLGDPAVYCEPFAGSLAVLLDRPAWHRGRVETVNDLDGFVANAWRAILHDPEHTAAYADWPVNENDLHARHAWLVQHRSTLASRLEGDPDWFDAKIAGWWLWGIACWIGGGFCSGQGPWQQVDGQLVHLSNAGQGVNRKRVHLGNAGRGVKRKRVHLGNAGRGVKRQLVHLGSTGQGVNRQLVHLGDASDRLLDWFVALSERLRHVRVCCGDWARVVTPSALAQNVGTPAIFLDPPYSHADRTDVYTEESFTVAHDVRAFCLAADPSWRIALCGYQGEHEELEAAGWTVVPWKARGGMANSGTRGEANAELERIWFSPACVPAVEQLSLV